MRYTAKYFRDSLPEWKRKKDSILVRNIYRPLSFLFAAFFSNIGINANMASFISLLLTFVIAALYLSGIYALEVAGAVCVSLWMVLDCTDGNIARSVKSMPYGEFLDAVAGYFCVEIIMISTGICAYLNESLFFSNNSVILLGAGMLAASFDALSRLSYQKFLNMTIAEQNQENKDSIGNRGKLYKIHDRIDKEMGLNGVFIPFLTISTIFRKYDLFVLVYFFYYAINLLGSMFILIKKTGLFDSEGNKEK